MSVEPVSSQSNQDILNIYAEGKRQQAQLLEKVTKINLELKMQADQNELAFAALMDFYA